MSGQFLHTSFAGPRHVRGGEPGCDASRPSSWWQLDLGPRHRLLPSYYTMRHDGSHDGFARSWVLQVRAGWARFHASLPLHACARCMASCAHCMACTPLAAGEQPAADCTVARHSLPRRAQGSNDLQHWLDLRRHDNDGSIRLPGQYASWPVSGPAAALPFRAFRLLLLGPTQSATNPWAFCLSHFELYGYFFKLDGA